MKDMAFCRTYLRGMSLYLYRPCDYKIRLEEHTSDLEAELSS